MKELYLLYASAASLGFVHTILGPDHYLPFIVLSKARNWSKSKTLWITFISGIGHVGSSIILGIIGIGLGISLNKLESIEAYRGEIVGWMLFIFGLTYLGYGVVRHLKGKGHHHYFYFLMPKRVREMHHLPSEEKDVDKSEKSNITFWMLFLIFVFGPCEVLIPLLIFPAYEKSTLGMLTVALIFGIATISTMLLAVFIGHKGTSLVKFKKQERYMHLFAGVLILISGGGILFLGW